MKLEIRKISVGSLLLSAFPLVVFAVALLRALMSPQDLAADATIMQSIMGIILQVLIETAAMLVLSLLTVFVYNLFCSFGIKGIRFDIEEVEVVSEENEEAK